MREMLAAIQHQASYASGSWIHEPGGVYVGWTAHGGSFADAMPVANERGDTVLVFCGEEYPDATVRSCLKARGHDFESSGASYLVHVCEDDPQFPRSLNGRFHGLVATTSDQRARLFNDRYGMHRLYYHIAKDAVYFAGEAKAILAVLPELRQIEPRSLGEFVSCGCVLENRTLFRGIQLLPPGSKWTFEAGALTAKERYFTPAEWENQHVLDKEEYHTALEHTFASSLPRYFNGHQRIGVSLTGGLDTRVVLAWRREAGGSIPSYTYGEERRECRDVKIARKVARTCGLSHEVISLGRAFFARFPQYAERAMYLTDACVDVTRAPDLYLSERAREIAPVRMTGLYGDEVLRPQERAFKPTNPDPKVFATAFLSEIRTARETYFAAVQTHPLSFAAFCQAPWHHYGALALEQTQLTVRTPFLDNDVIRTIFTSPASVTRNNDLRVGLIRAGDSRLGRIRTDRGFAGRGGALSKWAAAQFHQFTFKAEYAYDYGMPQWLARLDHAVSPLHLERLFLGRHKVYHYRVWYRDELSTYVKEMLLDSRTLSRPYLNAQQVRAIVDGHTTGRQNYTTEIHRVVSLELLHRLFVDN